MRIEEVPSASETKLAIRFADVDMMHVVHHAVYVYWFEQIRFEFLNRILNLTRAQLIEEKIGFPLIACQVQYLHAFAFCDEPVGYARVRLHRNATFTFDYWIYRSGQPATLYTLGSTTHCYVGAEMQLLLRPPDLLAQATREAKSRFPGCVIQENEA
jgi:acyl-CoA thioester hydrolase